MPDFDLLSETNACDLLARLFRARGYQVTRNIPFEEYGVSFHIDGWDPKARVGFEFLTSEDDDHDDLTLEEYKTLMAAQQRGELSLFVVDEVEPLSATDLRATAEDFLDEVAAARRAVRRPARPKAARKGRSGVARAAKQKPATKAAGRLAKKSAKKPAKKPAKAAAKTSAKKPRSTPSTKSSKKRVRRA